MTKKITGLLAVLVFTGWAGVTNAASVTISGFGADDGVYEIGLVNCQFFACPTDSSLLTSQSWWGNPALATAFVDDLGLTGLGAPNTDFDGSGPYFAYSRNGSGIATHVRAWLGFGLGNSTTAATDTVAYHFAIATSFTPTVVPLPAAGYLFITAIVGLFGTKRFARK